MRTKKKRPCKKCRVGKKLLIAFCLCTVIGTGYFLLNNDTPDVKAPPVTYTVQTGDTLWGIADKYKADNQDIRVMYLQIMTDNHIRHNEDIHPGQKLIISRK